MPQASPRAAAARVRRGTLDLTVIAETALRIIDQGGIDALTMRTLAAELGSSVNTLYWYARTKDEILAAVGELVIAQVHIPDGGDWDERLATIMKGLRAVLLAHPGLGAIGVNQPTSGPASLRLTNEILGLLRAGGLTEPRALAAMRILTGYAYGTTAMGLAYVSEGAEAYRTHIRGASPDQYPHLAAVGPHLAGDNSNETFELGLQLILDGLRRRT
jgi:TetR/AcrR family tetracycline transcriptional repressor